MKVRFQQKGVRIRIDDLELARLQQGQRLELHLRWPGGGWQVTVDPQQSGLECRGAHVIVGIQDRLAELLKPEQEGIRLQGDVTVDLEKDFGPGHLN